MKIAHKTAVMLVAVAATFGAGVSLSPAVYAQSSVTIRVGPPPPPRYEVMPPPRAGYQWAPGHWEWQRNRHAWVGGRWLRERPGYAYQAPRYVERNGRWAYERSRWDRDGDGVPNRHDSRPNNPYRR